MCRKKYKTMELDGVELLGFGDGTDDQFVEAQSGPNQGTMLKGDLGDLRSDILSAAEDS